MSKHLFVFFIEFIAVVPAILAQTFDSDFRLEKKLFPDDKILPSEFTVKKSTHHKDSEIFTINLRERETHHSSSIGGIKKQSQILITTKKNNSAILLLSSDSEYTNKTGVIFLHFIDFIFVDVLDGIIIVELKYGRLFIFRIPINHILKDMKGKNSSSIMPAFSYYVGKNNIPLKVTFNNSDNIISCLLTENEKTYKYDFMLNVDRHKINIKYVNNASCGKNDITKDRNIIKSSRPISLSQEEMERRKREFLDSQPRKELFSENELKELFTEPDYTRITDPLQLARAYDWFGKYPEALAALKSAEGMAAKFELGYFLKHGRPGVSPDMEKANRLFAEIVSAIEKMGGLPSPEDYCLAGRASSEYTPENWDEKDRWKRRAASFFQKAISEGYRPAYFYSQYYLRHSSDNDPQRLLKVLPSDNLEINAFIGALAGLNSRFKSQRNRDKNLEAVKAAIYAHSNLAQAMLGMLYLHSKTDPNAFLRHNPRKAKFWLQRAADRGDTDALQILNSDSRLKDPKRSKP